MSNYPTSLDTDITLPAVNDNINDIGAEAINALRDAVFQLEQALGINIAGSSTSLASRIAAIINPNGTLNASCLTGLGLITLPITNIQIDPNASITESKLHLDYRTQDLYNYIIDLSRDVNNALGWISVTGVKLDPHLAGVIYRHSMNQIDVASNSINFLNNKFNQVRDNTSSYSVVNDMNNELLYHQWTDSIVTTTVRNITTNGGSFYPSNYGHTASGIFIQSGGFSAIPQTINDVQKFANYIDNNSIYLLGTRIQNLYANGISRNSRSSTLLTDGYGQSIILPTLATTYLATIGSPIDDIGVGDDIIKITPPLLDQANNSFDEKFALVKVGDIIRVNYGAVEVPFVIKEKKYDQQLGNKLYIIRIAGKNLVNTTNASIRIDRALANNNKFGVLSSSPVNNVYSNASTPSLILADPRGAQALGIGFNPNQFDASHYLLYLALYPTGNPLDGYTILPGIDVTGNAGTTPGTYTLDSIVQATNNAFRLPGFNYRFVAFSYKGEFGIMLADSYNNSAFSILSATVAPDGTYSSVGTSINFPNNVVGIFAPVSPANSSAMDPLGFGPYSANIASPPLMTSYGSAEASQIPTKLFVPLHKNSYYVNGAEQDRLALDVNQIQDVYGDGYWIATIDGYNVIPGSRVEVTYKIPLDLSTSNLKAGKTLVAQTIGSGSLTDAGRFIIKSVLFETSPIIDTKITVWDAAHATGISPVPVSPIGTRIAIYFDSNSVSFNNETATDLIVTGPFKRHFEVYSDQNGNSFSQERGRLYLGSISPVIINGVNIYTDSNLSHFNIMRISPKLKGYQFGQINKIALLVSSYPTSTGEYSGQLCRYDGSIYTNMGPIVLGKRGQITRFYDETNIDYIDLVMDLGTEVIGAISSNAVMDIQLFPTLSLDKELMLLSTCQHNTINNIVDHFIDQRQFGNISEEELSTSALSFISAGNRLLQGNGVIRGFDLESNTLATNPNAGQIYLTGGEVLVNGNIIQINPQTINIPIVQESLITTYNINWALCINDKGEYQQLVLTDYDSVLGTPSNSSRLITLLNAVNGDTYLGDSILFSNLVNRRKDLTIIYIVSSTVSGSGGGATVSLSVKDARKFVNDGNYTTPITWTSDNSQGNFKTLSSLSSWIKYNSKFNNTVKLRGSFTISSQTTLDFSNNSTPVKFEGDGAIFNINAYQGLVLNNVSFKDVVFNVNYSTGLVLQSNVSLINCTFNYLYDTTGDGYYSTSNLVNTGRAAIYCNVAGSIQNHIISDCTFISGFSDRYAFVNYEFPNTTSALQNVNISNNKFRSTNSFSDKRAVLSFISKAVATGVILPHLIDCNVDENICDKDQMIILSTNDSNSSCVMVNVFVSKNICGTISYVSNINYATNFENTNIVFNKNAGLTIKENVFKLLASLDITGHGQVYPLPAFGLSVSNSGNVNIINNKLSWAWIYSSAAGLAQKTTISILNNRFQANDITYMDIFQGSGSVSVNSAINCNINSVYSPSFGTMIISQNYFEQSTVVAADNITTTQYLYTNHINIGYNATITDNTFTSIANDISNSIFITISNQTSNCIITGNQFYRYSNNIKAYLSIAAPNSIITNNIFDQPTVDGSNETLALNIDTTTIYNQNKNQSAYKLISFSSEVIRHETYNSYFADGYGYLIEALDSTFTTGNVDRIFAVEDVGGLEQRAVIKVIDLSSQLPQNVQLLQARAGVYKYGAGLLNYGGSNGINLIIYADTAQTYPAGLDVKNNFFVDPVIALNNAYVITAGAATLALESATQYLNIDLSSSNIRNNGTYLISSKINVVFQRTSGPILLQVSPLYIKYRW